jgi:anti-sigma regulatory factor (Ser/Thr protein kinase)
MQELEYDPQQVCVILDEFVESRAEAVDGFVTKLMERIAEVPCAQAHLGEVELALTEGLANAVVHGNRQDPLKFVHVWAGCIDGEQLFLVITDQGAGFDVRGIPNPTVAANIGARRGRGIFVMNQIMDTAEHRLGGRQLVLRKRIAPGGTAAT